MTTGSGATAPMSSTALAVYALLAVVLGLGAGWVDVHNDEVQAAVLVIVVASFLVTAAAGRKPWLFGLLVGLGIFFTYAAQPLIGFSTTLPIRLHETLIAVIPGMIGAYLGWGARRLFGAAASAL